MSFEKKRLRKLVLMVDYVNITFAATEQGCVIDLKELVDICMEKIGIIKTAFVFIPLNYVSEERIQDFILRRMKCIVCPKLIAGDKIKDKDKVDYHMTDLAKTCFDENSDVTDFVLVTNDGDFSDLAEFMRQRGKRVHLFGLGHMSKSLKRVVDGANIHRVPTKK